jgi:hypothetical protein
MGSPASERTVTDDVVMLAVSDVPSAASPAIGTFRIGTPRLIKPAVVARAINRQKAVTTEGPNQRPVSSAMGKKWEEPAGGFPIASDRNVRRWHRAAAMRFWWSLEMEPTEEASRSAAGGGGKASKLAGSNAR